MMDAHCRRSEPTEHDQHTTGQLALTAEFDRSINQPVNQNLNSQPTDKLQLVNM